MTTRIAIAALLVAASCERTKPPTPEIVVERIVGAPEGMSTADAPEMKAYLEAVRKNPGPHIPLLARHLDPAAVATGATDRASLSARVLILYAGEEGRKEAEGRLRSLIAECDVMRTKLDTMPDREAPEAEELARRYGGTLVATGAVFAAFLEAKDGRARDVALDRLAKRDADLAPSAIPYLNAVFPDDPKVQEAIKKYEGGG